MSSLLEEIVLDLGRKVEDRFDNIDSRLDDMRDSVHNLDIKIRDQHSALIDHSVADAAANNRVDKLEDRVVSLESRPVRYTKQVVSILVTFIGLISTLLGIAWSIRNLV